MTQDTGLIRGEDGLHRCWWGAEDPLYRAYHDHEWGFPVVDERRLFEKICLEGFQSGLSWLTILKKRENFRRAFADFDFHAVARFDEADVARLLADAGIVRHRGKIEATIHNAERAVALSKTEGGVARFFWTYEPTAAERPARMDKASLLSLTKPPPAITLSRALKAWGFKFVGPTTAYAFMQAMGLVNDHLEGCHVRQAVAEARAALPAPPWKT